MSYILDALKRAEARRGSEMIAGSPATTRRMVFASTRGHNATRPWIWLLLGLSVAALGWMAWRLAIRPHEPDLPLAAVAPKMTELAPPVLVAPPAPAPAPLPAPAPAPMAAPSPAPVPRPFAVKRAAPAAAASSSPSAQTATGLGPAAPASPRDELSAELRRELPALVVSGSTWSENAAYRMLIINGQVFNEGGEVATGVVLDQIQPRTAALRYKGYRFWLNY